MLATNKYTQDYLDDCRERVASHLTAYRGLVKGPRSVTRSR